MGHVFEKVTRPASVLILERGTADKHAIQVSDVSALSMGGKSDAIFDSTRFDSISQDTMSGIPSSLFIPANLAHYAIWEKVNSVPHKLLRDVVDEDGI